MTSIEVAAWVQAIGSIAAIAGGFGLFFLQQHHAARVRYRALYSMVLMAGAWAHTVKAEAEKLKNTSEWRVMGEEGGRAYRAFRPLFDRIDIGAIADEKVWRSMALFFGLYDELSYVLAEQVRYGETHAGSAPVPDDRRVLVLKTCDELLTVVDKFHDALDGGKAE